MSRFEHKITIKDSKYEVVIGNNTKFLPYKNSYISKSPILGEETNGPRFLVFVNFPLPFSTEEQFKEWFSPKLTNGLVGISGGTNTITDLVINTNIISFNLTDNDSFVDNAFHRGEDDLNNHLIRILDLDGKITNIGNECFFDITQCDLLYLPNLETIGDDILPPEPSLIIWTNEEISSELIFEDFTFNPVNDTPKLPYLCTTNNNGYNGLPLSSMTLDNYEDYLFPPSE